LNLFLSGFISSLPQLAWEKRLCCCCCCCIISPVTASTQKLICIAKFQTHVFICTGLVTPTFFINRLLPPELRLFPCHHWPCLKGSHAIRWCYNLYSSQWPVEHTKHVSDVQSNRIATPLRECRDHLVLIPSSAGKWNSLMMPEL